MDYFLIFILGLLFGSFANVIIYRLNTGESLIFGGSRCFFCGRSLKWPELIPVLSFLFLRGRCRTCGSKISLQYPAVELASGILFLFIYHIGSNGILPVLPIVFFWLLLVISIYDLRHKIIPDSLVYLAAAAGLSSVVIDLSSGFIFQASDLIPYFLSGVGIFIFFASLWFVSRGRWMGFGDAKMAFACGLFLGWPETVAGIIFSFWIGALFGVGFLVLRRIHGFNGDKIWRGVQIPFAPFLFLGSLIAFARGEAIISLYASLLQ